jgi:sugar phosphate isomerase/epimerase
MYTSISSGLLLSGGFSSVSDGLKALGIDSIELGISREFKVISIKPTAEKPDFTLSSDSAINEYKEHLEQNGVKISAIIMGNNFNSPDLETELNWVIKTIHIAEMLNIRAIRIDAIMSGERDMPIEKRQSHFAECMKKILGATESSSIVLGIENHGFQGNDPDFLDGVFAKINSKRLGLTMDMGNFYWAGHPLDRVYEILEHFAPITKHTHVKNIAYPADVRNTQRQLGWEYGKYVCPLPDGDIDIAKVVGFLKKAGYEGDLNIEDESLGKFPQEEKSSVLKREVDHIKNILKSY